jgi:uncharacterized DUF497 family protein
MVLSGERARFAVDESVNDVVWWGCVLRGEFSGFEWDPGKSAATFRQRGIDFENAQQVFDGPYFEREDLRRAYGERRYVTTGVAQGVVIDVIWTPRNHRRRIIAAWPASRLGRRAYHEYCSALERTGPEA